MGNIDSRDYCGCCGRLIPGRATVVRYWCEDCKKHIKHIDIVHPEDATYFAQYGKPCPFSNIPECSICHRRHVNQDTLHPCE